MLLRDLLKTGSFAALHFSVGFGVAYLISGSLPVALGVALIEPAVNTVVFFFHERAWKYLERAKLPVMTNAVAIRAMSRIEDHHGVRQLRHMALRG